MIQKTGIIRDLHLNYYLPNTHRQMQGAGRILIHYEMEWGQAEWQARAQLGTPSISDMETL